MRGHFAHRSGGPEEPRRSGLENLNADAHVGLKHFGARCGSLDLTYIGI